MQTLLHHKDSYFMDDPREGKRLERKANAGYFVEKFLKAHLDKLPNGIVLEAGCGSGAFLDILGRNYLNLSFTGIDISEDRVKQANTKLTGLKNAGAVVESIYHLPFPDNHFDFIYSRFLFEYLQDPVAATKELYRVCKPGAKLILQDLDAQFTLFPEVLPGLAGILAALKDETGFDPNVGRKLFSFGKTAGFSFLNAETEIYHKVFGKIDDFNYELWDIKLDIAVEYLKRMLGREKAEQLKKDILNTLKDENTVIFSNLFSVIFEKPETK
jgi:ubiquinone/menaquinone biosynthesis C-methylase UbiE